MEKLSVLVVVHKPYDKAMKNGSSSCGGGSCDNNHCGKCGGGKCSKCS